jgi:hypothetical protein
MLAQGSCEHVFSFFFFFFDIEHINPSIMSAIRAIRACLPAISSLAPRQAIRAPTSAFTRITPIRTFSVSSVARSHGKGKYQVLLVFFFMTVLEDMRLSTPSADIPSFKSVLI